MTSIWTKAKEMELEAVGYYNGLAEETSVSEVAGVFKMIAQEEKKHSEMFAKLESENGVDSLPSSTWDPKEAFIKIAQERSGSESLSAAKDAYKKIVDTELEAAEYYEGLKKDAKSDEDKNALDFIIKEEKKHAKIFQELVEFIERPESWVENAEFNILEDF